MDLAHEIQSLTNRTLTDLEASHDYYTYSKRVWRSLQKEVQDGRKFTFRNRMTGTTVNESALKDRAQLYLTEFLASSTFQHFVSLFEDFFFGLVRCWLVEFPESLSNRQVEFKKILEAPDKRAIILIAVDSRLNELKYGKLAEWFKSLDKLARLNCPSDDEIETLAEIMASRDILVHNNGIASATYVEKAGPRARYKDGERLEIPEPYHRDSWEAIKRVVEELSAAAIGKLGSNRQS